MVNLSFSQLQDDLWHVKAAGFFYCSIHFDFCHFLPFSRLLPNVDQGNL